MKEISLNKIVDILLNSFSNEKISFEKGTLNYIIISIKGKGSTFYDLNEGTILGTEIEWLHLFETTKDNNILSEKEYDIEKNPEEYTYKSDKFMYPYSNLFI